MLRWGFAWMIVARGALLLYGLDLTSNHTNSGSLFAVSIAAGLLQLPDKP